MNEWQDFLNYELLLQNVYLLFPWTLYPSKTKKERKKVEIKYEIFFIKLRIGFQENTF